MLRLRPTVTRKRQEDKCPPAYAVRLLAAAVAVFQSRADVGVGGVQFVFNRRDCCDDCNAEQSSESLVMGLSPFVLTLAVSPRCEEIRISGLTNSNFTCLISGSNYELTL